MRYCSYLRVGLLFGLASVVATELQAKDFVEARLDGLTHTGDVLAYFLPATALGMTAYFKDREGAWEFAESAGITMAITVGLKYAINARRPTGEPYSFPSGHSAITFSSAEFLRKRYGWKCGVPAYVFASFVGYSRVRANVHYFRDVAAGAAIGIVTTHIVSTPFKAWHIQPVLEANYRGFRVSRDF